jgi:hypothetical protein
LKGENELLKRKCWRKIAEGKRIAEEELLKGSCQRGIAEEELIESLH